MNVIEVTATEVATLSADELQGRGVPSWAIEWILANRQAGAVRIDVPMVTVTPLSVLEDR